MRAYGKKKIATKVKGHQQCAICHPSQKNKKNRGRKQGEAEIAEAEGELLWPTDVERAQREEEYQVLLARRAMLILELEELDAKLEARAALNRL